VPAVSAPDDRPTLLVTLTGKDRPGVTTTLFDAVAVPGVDVLDVEQVLLRGRLVLGALLTVPDDATEAVLRTAVEAVAADRDMEVDLVGGRGDNRPRREGRTHVTVLGAPLTPEAFAAVTGRIAQTGGNIDRIQRMARHPVTALELDVSGVSPDVLRRVLAAEAARQRVDVAVQPAGISRHAQRLVVMDVDSTLVQGEVIEMVAEHAGCRDEVAAITDQAMRGELDFAESLRRRVALLAGVRVCVLDEVYRTLTYAPGARTVVRTLRRLGYRFGLVSGGFTQVIDQIAAELEVDYAAANVLEVSDGRLTGRLLGDVIDRAGKAAALRRFAADARIPLADTIAVGDGANDLDMLAAAGLGVAFNAKAVVRDAADTAVTTPYLDSILYLLGITRDEVEAAGLP
jgi:phosphoserine phosphatase